MSGRWVDRPGTALTALAVLVAMLAASVLFQGAVAGETHAEIERWTGGMALLGALAVGLVAAISALAGRLLGRPDDGSEGDVDGRR